MEHRLTALGVTGQGSPLTLRHPILSEGHLALLGRLRAANPPPSPLPRRPRPQQAASPPPGDAVAMTTKVSRGRRWGHAETTALLSVVGIEGGSIVTQLDQSLG